ncbi:MAG: hypothetical protein KA120_00090 [Candidatus Goldbacteria bacterium]|nr:hypothetical protein [Candidatus Goldiibacteriota bacterium]
MKKLYFIFAFFMLTTFSFSFYDWCAIKNEKFTLFYRQEYEKRALQTLSALNSYSHIAEDIVGNSASSLSIVLDDYGTYVNGYTDPVFYNVHIMNYDSGDADWLSLCAIHEYTHILHLTKSEGLPRVFTTVVGHFLSPQIFSPLWVDEAITVYNESKISPFMGRLNDGGFDSYIGTCIYENKFPSILKATYMPLESPFGNGPYLFGSEFFNFLAVRYGENKFKKFYDSYGGSVLSYLSPIFPWLGMDRTFDEIFGKTTIDLWNEWQEYEKERFKNYKQPGEKITNYGGYVSYPAVKTDKLYFVKTAIDKNGAFSTRTRQDVVEMDLNTNEQEIYFSTTSNVNHPLRFDGANMYYSIDEIKPGFANKSNRTFGQYSVIYEKNMLTNDEKEILSGEIRTYFINYGKLTYAKDKVHSFGSEMFEYDVETKEDKFIMDTDYHVMLLDSDGKNVVCIAKKQGENPGLYLFDKNKKTLKLLIDTPYIENDAVICDDKIFFKSNYEKIYSIYCYDLKTDKVYRLTDNGVAGSPAYDTSTGDLYFVGLNTDGFDVYRIKKPESREYKFKEAKFEEIKYPILKENEISKGSYWDNLLTLWPRIRMPLVAYDSDGHLYGGLLLSGADAVGDFNWTGQMLYDVNDSVTYQDFLLSSNIFAPLKMNFSYSNNNDKRDDRLKFGINYPLYVSYRPGLSQISININYLTFDDFLRNRMDQGIDLGFNYPDFNFGLSASAIFEDKALNPDDEIKEGYYGRFAFSYFLHETKIMLLMNGFYGLNENVDNSVDIRGYKDSIYSDKAISGIFEISRNLLKIRRGLWNPINVYVEDLSGLVFFDNCVTEHAYSYSYGLELHLETKFAFYATADVGFRISMNRDNEFNYAFLIKMPYLLF